MNNPVFSRSECLSHYKWGDDCHGWNFVDTDTLSVKQELMPPDTAEQLHYHEKATQIFFILKGRAVMTIDGVEQRPETRTRHTGKPRPKAFYK
jgi:mannose-6-phosphate isomerase-like protein (cupin superfamily)